MGGALLRRFDDSCISYDSLISRREVQFSVVGSLLFRFVPISSWAPSLKASLTQLRINLI